MKTGSTHEQAPPSASPSPPIPDPAPTPSKGAAQYRYVRAAVRAALRDPNRFVRDGIDDLDRRHPFVGWVWGLLHLDFVGLLIGGLFLMASATASLVPRSWFFQGFVAGVTSVIGYGIGVLGKWVIVRLLVRGHPVADRPALARWVPWCRLAIVVAVAIGGLVALFASKGWQDQLRALMGMPPASKVWYLLTPLVAFAIAATLISVFRVLRDLSYLLGRRANRYLRVPMPAAQVLGFVVVFVLVAATINVVGYRGFTDVTNRIASTTNDTRPAGFDQPTESTRSGSAQSYAKWDGLGMEGRKFVAGGLHAAGLARYVPGPVTDPVRVYVGLENAPTPQERVAILQKEIARTGALDRKRVVVIPTTGSGWVNPTAARAIELMYGGDVALIAAQYSYLPSWVSFLTEQQKSSSAGRRLVDAVLSDVEARPRERRPQVLLLGESLGTRAGEGAFSSLADIRARVDGVVWIGPPRDNAIHSEITARRDLGTPEVLPVYTDGLTVRFTDGVTPLADNGGPQWLRPHIAYVQHASDPVVWWSPDLILRRPDWLREPPGRDRSPTMRWYPFVTFWQVTADLANAAGVPDGHGHNYGTAVVDAVAAVLPPQGWTRADTERVRAAVKATMDIDGPEK